MRAHGESRDMILYTAEKMLQDEAITRLYMYMYKGTQQEGRRRIIEEPAQDGRGASQEIEVVQLQQKAESRETCAGVVSDGI